MKIFFIIFLVSLLGLVQEGTATLSCGSSPTGNIVMNHSLHCENPIYLEGSSLNCNGHSISGTNTKGIVIDGYSNIKIENCNFENFSQAILIRVGTRTIGGGWGGIHVINVESNNVKIINSTFANNKIGIYARESYNSLISNSTFRNHSHSGIYFNEGQGKVLNNSFYNSNISYKTTKGLSFCENGNNNSYYNSTGPTCSCMPISKTSLINSDITLCSQKYPIEEPLKITSGKTLNCNKAKLTGSNFGKAIVVEGAQNTLIEKCAIENFSTGIYYKQSISRHGSKTRSHSNAIKDSRITNVTNAISMQYDSQKGLSMANNITNSTLIAQNYAINNPANNIIYAKDNFYGTNNISKIKEKIRTPQVVVIEPFKKKQKKITIFFENNSYNITPNISYGNVLPTSIKFFRTTNGKLNLVNFQNPVSSEFSLIFNASNFSKEDIIMFFENKTHNNLIDFSKEESKEKKYIEKNFQVNINNNLYNYSYLYFPVKNNSKKTIILSSGLWGSFDTWREFALKFQKNNISSYTIALSGESQECLKCYNYSYQELVNLIFPQHIEEIKKQTNSSELIYIGHSNGASVAYNYLEKNNTSLITEFIFLGMPGSFKEPTLTSSLVKKFNNSIKINLQNKSHISFKEILLSPLQKKETISTLISILGDSSSKISTALYRYYHKSILETQDSLFSLNTNTSIIFINGNLFNRGDGVVSFKDSQDIIKNTNASNKKTYFLSLFHTQLTTHPKIYSLLLSLL